VSGKAAFVFERELYQTQHLPTSQEKEINLSKYRKKLKKMSSSYSGRFYIIPQIRIIINLEFVLDGYV